MGMCGTQKLTSGTILDHSSTLLHEAQSLNELEFADMASPIPAFRVWRYR